jgi:hypothetical protein
VVVVPTVTVNDAGSLKDAANSMRPSSPEIHEWRGRSVRSDTVAVAVASAWPSSTET